MRPTYFAQLLASLACWGALTVTALAEERLTLSTGADYSTGKYGGAAATEIWYIPVAAKYETGPATFRLTIPYLRVTAPSGGNIIGVDDEGHVIYDGTGGRTTRDGLGDVVLSGTYSLWDTPRWGVLVDLGAKVKFGTADIAQGLGTGQDDYAVFADFYWPMGKLTPFATLGYRWMGDPAGMTLNDVPYTSLGLAYKLATGDSAGIMYDARQPTRDGYDGIQELSLYWTHKLAPDLKFQTYGSLGMSDASPAWGLGAVVSLAR